MSAGDADQTQGFPAGLFNAATEDWLRGSFAGATPVQRAGWPVVAGGRHALMIAPTGSGKTLAAFLWALDRRIHAVEPERAGVRVLYISPLKALVYDVERNLRSPLAGILRAGERRGLRLRRPGAAVRTGDTTQRERRALASRPPEILATTPESLFLMLGAGAAASLTSVEMVVVDEVHALAGSKRGAHLALSLERLAAMCGTDPQRVGLSATARPAAEIAGFLGGDRAVEVIDETRRPQIQLRVTVPADESADGVACDDPGDTDDARPGGSILGELYRRDVGHGLDRRPSWPSPVPRLLALIRTHRSTIVFVNSRAYCERMTREINEAAGEELALSHHGSVSHDRRAEVEESLKLGRAAAIVATSSLELGVDMGAVDLVVMVESPGSVASGLQRIGRAGHRVDQSSEGELIPKYPGDLLEAAVIGRGMLAGDIESIRAPRNPLDVLAQHLVAMCLVQPRRAARLHATLVRAWPYRELSREALDSTLDMLSGSYPSNEFADLRPYLRWDRAADTLSARRGAAMASRLNAGTIPDRGSYRVTRVGDGTRLGELDEEMVFETRVGDVVYLGASSWRVEGIERDRVVVSPAPGEPGKLPFWRGDGPGRPIELGRAIGGFLRAVDAAGDADPGDVLADAPLDQGARRRLLEYLQEQRHAAGPLPTDRRIVVERFRDEMGDWRVCLLSPFGARVHAPWATAVRAALSRDSGFDVQVMYTDDGIVLRFADTESLPEIDTLIPDPDSLEEVLTGQLADTAEFAALFRESAARALLLPRRSGGRRNPLWQQRLKAQNLLAAVRRYPAFPIVLETYRELLADHFDLPALKGVLRDIGARRIRVREVETPRASPFARSLVSAYVAAYIYEQDQPLAERRAQALTLDRAMLAQLVGQDELRDLLDAGIIDQVERERQGLEGSRRAADYDQVHDLLRRVGDLSDEEIADRTDGFQPAWLARLAEQRRAVQVAIAGEMRWIAAEDAGLFRDATGANPPPGLPERFIARVDRPLRQLLERYAAARGPFVEQSAASRYGAGTGAVGAALRTLEAEGRLVHGGLDPRGAGREWCHVDVLAIVKRRTLARLRAAVAPVESPAFGRFLAAWQHIEEPLHADRLVEAVSALEGIPLPWSAWLGQVLPARVRGFRPEMLDMAAATGTLAWIGCGALGARDGRVALYRRENLAALQPAPAQDPVEGELQAVLLDELRARGARFWFDLDEAVRARVADAGSADVEEALWDLVWAGRLSNDTFQPLHGLGRRRSGGRRRRRERVSPGGRWWRVDDAVGESPGAEAVAVARATMLLDRYGVVARDAARAEALPGGFGAVYRTLAAMEEAGRVRRGYFVEGLAGAQFAAPGAVDRLRGFDEEAPADGFDASHVMALPACDPANPWGALLPWPESAVQPRRVAGAWVLTAGGRPVLYVSPGLRHLVTFVSHDAAGRRLIALCLVGLRGLGAGGRRLATIEKLNGEPVADSPLRAVLLEAGFESDYKGIIVPGSHGRAHA